jgi:hypothetical protein
MQVLDWLADTVLTVLAQQTQLAPTWIADKRIQLTGLSRLKILQWIVADLDDGNLSIVAGHLGVSVQDFAAVRRVLSKI